MKTKPQPQQSPSEQIREIMDKRRASKGLDELDILFGAEGRLLKSVIQFLDLQAKEAEQKRLKIKELKI